MAGRLGMLIDLRKCYGCHSCTVACKQEHDVPPGRSWIRMQQIGPEGEFPDLRMHYVTSQCAQCQNAPCMDVCAEDALRRRSDGVVTIDESACTGCQLCVDACPYGAMVYAPERGFPEKCDLCAHRLDKGALPACVMACVGRARLVGDLNDPESQISKALTLAGSEGSYAPPAEPDTAPSLYYIKPNAATPALAFTSPFDPDQADPAMLARLVPPPADQGESVVRTICRGCHGVCGVLGTVRDGIVVKIEGDPTSPTSFGTLCPKGLAAVQHQYHPDRLLYPLKRVGERGEGRWQRISWDEALDTIAAKLNEIKETYGPEYVALGSGTGRTWNSFGNRFFYAFGSMTNLPMSPLCYFPRIRVSQTMLGYKIPISDYYGFGGEYPKCVLVWGNNLVAANSDGMAGARMIDTINRGAKLIVIDPVFGNVAGRADRWLPVRPASDAPLAFAFLNTIIEERLFDEYFVRRWSNGPFLVRRDTGNLLAGELSPQDPPNRSPYLVWDRVQNRPMPPDQSDDPALDGEWQVELADGSVVACTTAWQLLRERLSRYAPEAVESMTWVSAEKIRSAARLFATSKPAVIQWGNAIDHQGVNTTATAQAILTLMAITGNMDVPGGMAFWVTGDWIDGPSPQVIRTDLIPQRIKEFSLNWGRREFPLFGGVHGSLMTTSVADGTFPLQAAIVIGHNPVLAAENGRQVYDAFMKIPFVVALDLYMTPSAELADIVLPISTWLERDQIADELHFVWSVFCRQRVVEPRGECRSDEEILLDLAKRMGMGEDFPWATWQDYLDWRLHRTGLTWETFKERGMLRGPMRYRKYATSFYRPDGGFNTPSGRAEIYAPKLAKLGGDPLPAYHEPPEETPLNAELSSEYSLLATNRRVPYYFHTEFRQLGWLRELEPDPIVEINEQTAADLGIRTGDWVWIETRRGKIKQKARLTKGIHPRVVCIQHGWWFPEKSVEDDLHGAWESNFNVLTRNDRGQGFDPLLGTPQLRGFLCKVYKV